MTFSKRFVLRGLLGLVVLGPALGAGSLWAQDDVPAVEEARATDDSPIEEPVDDAAALADEPDEVPADELAEEPVDESLDLPEEEAAQDPDADESDPAEPADAKPAAHGAIHRALQTVTQIDVVDSPLADVVSVLREQHGIEIQLDSKALEDAGVTPDTPVTLNTRGLTLGATLRHVLRQKGLTWAVADGALVITTPEEAEQSYLETRVYPVADLVAPRPFAASADANAESLMELIANSVSPDQWDHVGGPGAVRYRGGALSVHQTQEVHERLAGLLGALREARGEHPAAVIAPPAANENAQRVRQAIDEALARPIQLDLTDVPLIDVVSMLVRERQLPILLDNKALEDAGVTPDTPATLSIRGVPLESALRHLFRQHDLTWMVRDEALVITTPEESEQSGLEVRVFPVASLLRSTSGEDEDDSFDDLIETVQQTVGPDTWDVVGGWGSLEPDAGARALVCLQTEAVQAEVAKLLAELTRAQSAQPQAAQWASEDDQRLELRVHPLVLKQGDRSLGDADSIAMLIHEQVAPDSWQGGQGASLRPLGDRLVVRHTKRVQREIERLLGQLGVSPEKGFAGGSSGMHMERPARSSGKAAAGK